MNFAYSKKLITPDELKNKYPVSAYGAQRQTELINAVRDVLSGADRRLIVIVGPCSADNERAVLDYASRLMKLSEKLRDKLIIIPRVYTAKPRTAAGTYKGILHAPNPTEDENIPLGIELSRKLHASILNETGFATADEMLYPEFYRYIDDCLCYAAIGARSSENQFYRLFASAMDIPVGLKNPTSGNISDMVNACECAQLGGGFIFGGEAVTSNGNDYAHCILRGGNTRNCENFAFDKLMEAAKILNERKIKNPALIIDANHGNSGKDHKKEPSVCIDVMNSREREPILRSFVKGFMIESFIEEGCQPIDGGVYGKSITDSCLGFEDTERLLYKLAEY